VDSNGSKTFYFYDPKRNELLQLTDTGWKTVKPNKSEELGREIVEDILTEKVLTQNAAGGKVAIPKTQNLTDIEQKAILAEIRDAIGVASGLETQKPEEQAMLKAKENALSAMAKLFREGLNSQEAREFIRKTGVNPETFLKKYAELERVTGLEQRVLGDRSANPDLKNEISFWRRHLIDDLMSNSFHDDAKLGRKTRAVLRGTDTPESLSRVLKARGLNTQAV
jgi:DNA-binding transcriptional regulator YhcF (GntR family)